MGRRTCGHGPSDRPAAAQALVDGAFLVCLAGVVWRELAAGNSWNHAPVGLVVSLYACANLLFHLSVWSDADTDRPFRMALALMMVLLTLIGGRLVPNFTREFLGGQGGQNGPRGFHVSMRSRSGWWRLRLPPGHSLRNRALPAGSFWAPG